MNPFCFVLIQDRIASHKKILLNWLWIWFMIPMEFVSIWVNPQRKGRYQFQDPCHPDLINKQENSIRNRLFSLDLISFILYLIWLQWIIGNQCSDQLGEGGDSYIHFTLWKDSWIWSKEKSVENEPCLYVLLLFYFSDQWHRCFSFGEKDLRSLKYPRLPPVTLVWCIWWIR